MALDKQKLDNMQNKLDLTERRETKENSLGLQKKRRGEGFSDSIDNLVKIFEQDSKLKGAFQYNEFTYELNVTKPLKLNSGNNLDGVVDDLVIKEVLVYVSTKYGIDYKKSAIQDVLEVVARRNSYIPLKDYLLACEAEYQQAEEQRDPFDMVRYYLNIEDNEHNRLAFEIFLRGAVAKVFEPSVKFDFVLDLTGRQGVGKTQFFEGLFKDHFTTIETFTDKDDKARMVRSWCVFDDEMVATKKASFSELKKFITEREMAFRPPYASSDRRLLKNFVIVRATNDDDYLNDLTGSRRFLVVKVHRDSAYKGRSWSDSDRRLLWGAVVTKWRDNPNFELTDDQETLLNKERERYKVHDNIIEDLNTYVETKIPSKFYLLPPNNPVRQYYVHDTIEYGAYMNANGEVIQLDPQVHGELVERDRMTLKTFFGEVYGKTLDKVPKEDRNKVKMAMQNKEGWEWKKGIKFGKKNTSGYKKVR